MSPNKLTGRVMIKFNGVVLQSREGAGLENITGIERTAQSGGDGVHGFTEKVVPPRVTCTLSHGSKTPDELFGDADDISLTFVCDSGESYILDHAWRQNGLKLTGGEGSLDVVFEAPQCKRVAA